MTTWRRGTRQFHSSLAFGLLVALVTVLGCWTLPAPADHGRETVVRAFDTPDHEPRRSAAQRISGQRRAPTNLTNPVSSQIRVLPQKRMTPERSSS